MRDNDNEPGFLAIIGVLAASLTLVLLYTVYVIWKKYAPCRHCRSILWVFRQRRKSSSDKEFGDGCWNSLGRHQDQQEFEGEHAKGCPVLKQWEDSNGMNSEHKRRRTAAQTHHHQQQQHRGRRHHKNWDFISSSDLLNSAGSHHVGEALSAPTSSPRSDDQCNLQIVEFSSSAAVVSYPSPASTTSSYSASQQPLPQQHWRKSSSLLAIALRPFRSREQQQHAFPDFDNPTQSQPTPTPPSHHSSSPFNTAYTASIAPENSHLDQQIQHSSESLAPFDPVSSLTASTLNGDDATLASDSSPHRSVSASTSDQSSSLQDSDQIQQPPIAINILDDQGEDNNEATNNGAWTSRKLRNIRTRLSLFMNHSPEDCQAASPIQQPPSSPT